MRAAIVDQTRDSCMSRLHGKYLILSTMRDAVVQVPSFPAQHGFSTSALGSMGLNGSLQPEAVMQQRQAFADIVGFDLGRAALAAQVHGARVHTFRRDAPTEGGQSVLDTDALATDVPGQALMTYHADCYPVLFVDRAKGAVAAAHLGWRGALARIAGETIQAMVSAYGTRPADVSVLIGPGICRACYEVGPEVFEPISRRYGRSDVYLRERNGRALLDLGVLAELQLRDAGVDPGRIERTGWCTREDERWFSHRGKRPGRFLAAIVLP
jgi:purine-nucleoside/S-methyl-5'-thioadenosine phosphorylase / adenosine deaminase